MEFHGFGLSLLAFVVLASIADAGHVGRCTNYCSGGLVLDTVSCNCVRSRVYVNSYPVCPSLNCGAGRSSCRRYRRDANGCNTCQCLDRCQYRSRCPDQCQWGSELYVDDGGCSACRCRLYAVSVSSSCNSLFQCQTHCPHGYIQDRSGCNTCQCRATTSCGFLSGCTSTCQFGRLINSNGCELCECKPKPLCGPVCANTCSSGRVLNEYGCPTCQCLAG